MPFSSQPDCRLLVLLSRGGPVRAGSVAIWLGIVAALLAGCRTAQYKAASLPPRLDVPPMRQSNDINLAQLAGAGAGTSEIAPGDLIELTVASGSSAENPAPTRARVVQDGTVLVPLVGPVQVSGLEPYAAEQRIAAAAIERQVFRQPYVTLRVEERAVNRVTVLGAVAGPGVVELARGSSDLASALAAAGGLSDDAGTEVDVLRHGNSAVAAGAVPTDGARVQLASYNGVPGAGPGFAPPALADQASTGAVRIDLANVEHGVAGYELADRDVVMVLPEKKRVIHVTGLVEKPDRFEVSPKLDVRVLDAITMAGGISSPLADKVFVIRQLPEMAEPVVIRVSIAKAKRDGRENLRLTSGDLVSVESTPATMLFDTASTLFRTTIGIGGNFAAF